MNKKHGFDAYADINSNRGEWRPVPYFKEPVDRWTATTIPSRACGCPITNRSISRHIITLKPDTICAAVSALISVRVRGNNERLQVEPFPSYMNVRWNRRVGSKPAQHPKGLGLTATTVPRRLASRERRFRIG